MNIIEAIIRIVENQERLRVKLQAITEEIERMKNMINEAGGRSN